MSDSATAWTVAYQAPPSMEFSRQECWSGLPFPSPGDLPDPGIKPGSSALQAVAFPSEPPGEALNAIVNIPILKNTKYIIRHANARSASKQRSDHEACVLGSLGFRNPWLLLESSKILHMIHFSSQGRWGSDLQKKKRMKFCCYCSKSQRKVHIDSR